MQGGSGLSLHQLLRALVDKGGSDLHISAHTPPQLRIDGSLLPLKTAPLTPQQTKELCYSVLTEDQKVSFEKRNEVDFSFGVKGLSRFRANLFVQRGAVSGVFRRIPFRILSFDELGLPKVIASFANLSSGLVLITGATGSGKSTTLAAVIDKINAEARKHIITVEDPIEFVHRNKLCVINQREVGSDTHSFGDALKHVLRQDPDVVLVGELRDQETIEAALTISETGHLVFATLHTNSATQTVTRIVDVFPGNQRDQIRLQLSFVLQGVVTQMLLPRSEGPGRNLALEIMIPNSAIRNLIREDKLHQVYSVMQTGQHETGMQTMNQALFALYRKRQLSAEEAVFRSDEPAELQAMIQRTARLAAS
ncbi:MAG: type IV pilus twitching motility protein PilT [Proteobacteria bacterium]|nr:type IV pilus twitching motility protein PilT [Pseudomonadota bacterium]